MTESVIWGEYVHYPVPQRRLALPAQHVKAAAEHNHADQADKPYEDSCASHETT